MTADDREAIARIVAADPRMPGLRVLLDDAAASDYLGAKVTRRHLRYKPGTSATVLWEVAGTPVIATAWSVDVPTKREKAIQRTPPEGLLRDDPKQRLVAIDAAHDRRLPALRWLGDPRRRDSRLSAALASDVTSDQPITLAHKPARRWVGHTEIAGRGEEPRAVVLRAYRRKDLTAAAAAYARVATIVSEVVGSDDAGMEGLQVAGVLGVAPGLLVVEHVPGEPLDRAASADQIVRLGAGLAAVHGRDPSGSIATGSLAAGASAIPSAAAAPVDTRSANFPGLDIALPDLPRRVADLEALASSLVVPEPRTTIHGDLSLDQVIAGATASGRAGELTLIDLDRSRTGSPSADLGSLVAARLAQRVGDGDTVEAALTDADTLTDSLLRGYASASGISAAELRRRVAPHATLAVLARVAEPFRTGAEHWVEVTESLLEAAAAQVRPLRETA